MHAAAVDLLQWQDTKLQWQDTKLQWQDTKCSSRIPNCMPAAAFALLQWQDNKLHTRMAALLQWQVLNLLHIVKDEQTCNNKARCISAELCKLAGKNMVYNAVDS
jgi:hypothetical protein